MDNGFVHQQLAHISNKDWNCANELKVILFDSNLYFPVNYKHRVGKGALREDGISS